jgi:hypothetical protein
MWMVTFTRWKPPKDLDFQYLVFHWTSLYKQNISFEMHYGVAPCIIRRRGFEIAQRCFGICTVICFIHEVVNTRKSTHKNCKCYSNTVLYRKVPKWLNVTFIYRIKMTEICTYLKVPKHEIFVTELFILSDPIRVGDLRTEPKKPFV